MIFTLRHMDRHMDRADIPDVLSLLGASFPCMVLTEDALRWREDHPHPEFVDRRILAVDQNGVPAGFVRTRVPRSPDESGHVKGDVMLLSVRDGSVDTDEVRTALMAEAERAARADGATRARAEVCGEAVQVGGERLATLLRERGYTQTLEEHRILRLDLSDLPEPPPVPDGVELRPFTTFTDDPRPLYEVDREATTDEPGERQGEEFMAYEEWLHNVWPHPLTDLDVSLAVLVEGRVVGFTAYVSDRDTRMESMMTGVLAAQRGRGLAGLAKATALYKAREHGIRYAYTGNHADNAPMLAINTGLGYRVAGEERLLARPDGQG